MNNIFKDPKTLSRLCEAPLGPYLNLFAKLLREQGFNVSTARLQIQMIGAFNRWLQVKHIAATQLSAEHVRKYIRYRDRRHLSKRSAAVSALRRLLDLLYREGVIAKDQAALPTLAEKYTVEFVRYLKVERALATTTAIHYQKFVMRFLTDWFAGAEVDLSAQRQAVTLHAKQSKMMTTALRSFLQFARYQNYISIDLAAVVPAFATWSMAGIPRFLPRDQVELIIACCDRQTVIGRRDYAILLLLARLGLRAGEIVSLTLEDIDWRQGQIAVNGKTGYRPHLPLPTDVGEAIAAYLRDGRPRTNSRTVFLRGEHQCVVLKVRRQ